MTGCRERWDVDRRGIDAKKVTETGVESWSHSGWDTLITAGDAATLPCTLIRGGACSDCSGQSKQQYRAAAKITLCVAILLIGSAGIIIKRG